MNTSPLFFLLQNFKDGLTIKLCYFLKKSMSVRKYTLWDVRPKARLLSYSISFLFLFFYSCVLTVRQSYASFPQEYSCNIDLNAIKSIESGGNPLAFNPKDHDGKGSRGLFQVSEGLRLDYNRLNKASVSPEDLFNPSVNTKIAIWSFGIYFPAILKRLKKPLTAENLIVCQNAGCGALKRKSLPKITINYLKKYRRISNV